MAENAKKPPKPGFISSHTDGELKAAVENNAENPDALLYFDTMLRLYAYPKTNVNLYSLGLIEDYPPPPAAQRAPTDANRDALAAHLQELAGKVDKKTQHNFLDLILTLPYGTAQERADFDRAASGAIDGDLGAFGQALLGGVRPEGSAKPKWEGRMADFTVDPGMSNVLEGSGISKDVLVKAYKNAYSEAMPILSRDLVFKGNDGALYVTATDRNTNVLKCVKLDAAAVAAAKTLLEKMDAAYASNATPNAAMLFEEGRRDSKLAAVINLIYPLKENGQPMSAQTGLDKHAFLGAITGSTHPEHVLTGEAVVYLSQQAPPSPAPVAEAEGGGTAPPIKPEFNEVSRGSPSNAPPPDPRIQRAIDDVAIKFAKGEDSHPLLVSDDELKVLQDLASQGELTRYRGHYPENGALKHIDIPQGTKGPYMAYYSGSDQTVHLLPVAALKTEMQDIKALKTDIGDIANNHRVLPERYPNLHTLMVALWQNAYPNDDTPDYNLSKRFVPFAENVVDSVQSAAASLQPQQEKNGLSAFFGIGHGGSASSPADPQPATPLRPAG